MGVIGTLLLVAAVAGAGQESAQAQAQEQAQEPGAGWQRFVDPADAGFSTGGLAGAWDFAHTRGVPALMVVSRGAVVGAWGEVDRRLPIHSIRKSLLSVLYGVYADRIDLDATLGELGIDERTPLTAAEKGARVRDLLAARSGIYLPAAGEAAEVSTDRPERGSHPPDTFWWYNNWDFNAAGTAFERLTGVPVLEALHTSLAVPMGLQDWRPTDAFEHREPDRSIHPSFGANLSTRDLARIGVLMASGGRWGDAQLVPRDWVELSTRWHSDIDMRDEYGTAYGYMWWVDGTEGFSARGYGGHVLAVYPEDELVVVVRADTFHDRFVSNRALGILIDRVREAKTGEAVADARLEAWSGVVPEGPDGRSGPARAAPSRPTAADLAPYAGVFPLASGDTVAVAASDAGLTLDYGRGVFDLIPLEVLAGGAARFLTADTRDEVWIELGADGRAERVLSEPVLYLEAAAAAAAGDVDGAVAWVRTAVEAFPESPSARFNFARALHGSGDRGAALAQLDTALTLDPDHDDARRLRRSLGVGRFLPMGLGALVLTLVLLGVRRLLRR
ncbi:serine hydrolase [Gemmatimonadota bacterium DH-20]|uniref:Serine hydrolase n=1 Tax=Gaopeijia maritima TaxID=3119007 RepID=A0ABU9EEX7_9BACT